MPSRTWIKLYCEKWLKGTLREETREFRGDWSDILALAGNLSFGDVGVIQLADGVGLSDEQIAGIFNIPVKAWRDTKQRAVETGRIAVEQNNVINVCNFTQYQSEYSRQKIYRQPKVLTAKLIDELSRTLGRRPTKEELAKVLETGDLEPEECQKIIEIAGKNEQSLV